MDNQEVINNLDKLVFSSTGKHFNDLQRSILEGVLNGQKYSEMQENYHRGKGHIKDEAYKLWQILSKTLNEDINKHNLKATIQRITSHNYNVFGNPLQIGNKINLCHNLGENKEEIKNRERDEENVIKLAQKQAKLGTISRLLKLGLTCEQIAHALDFPLELVLESLKLSD